MKIVRVELELGFAEWILLLPVAVGRILMMSSVLSDSDYNPQPKPQRKHKTNRRKKNSRWVCLDRLY